MSVVIQVENLSKCYRLGMIGGGTLRADVSRWLAKLQGRADPNLKIGQEHHARLEGQEFWALQDVSFEVKRGEILGIIGRNGAGKSTLLKILSRVTSPTSGEVRVKGRIASLLEVGTGFHPELTGRENIFLNGAILGMTKAEIRKKSDEIIAFSEVEQFIDTPVKRYSSGMYVRLAFAVAAHLEPEILIVDEVLAVGDAAFQKKCMGKMQDVAIDGRTILFVSHNMAAITSLCSTCVLLSNGQVLRAGGSAECIDLYSGGTKQGNCLTWSRIEEPDASLYFSRVNARLLGQQPRLTLELTIELVSRSSHASAFVAVDILASGQIPVMQALPRIEPFICHTPTEHKYRLLIELHGLVPGSYYTNLWTGSHNTTTFDHVERVVQFTVVESPTKGRTFPHGADHGMIVPLSSVEPI